MDRNNNRFVIVAQLDEMARSMGVAAARVEKPSATAGAIETDLAHGGPFLIDLVLDGTTSHERTANHAEASKPCLIS